MAQQDSFTLALPLLSCTQYYPTTAIIIFQLYSQMFYRMSQSFSGLPVDLCHPYCVSFQVEASHKTSLEKLPRILILHLKYFIYDKTGGCQKSHKAIEIERALEIPTGEVFLYFLVTFHPSMLNQLFYASIVPRWL